jgi:predicted ATPase
MPIERVIVRNFKSLASLDLSLHSHLNILVGDNERGKSTVLEAIHAALTCQWRGRNLMYELSPSMFNNNVVAEYLKSGCADGGEPPTLLIELYFADDPALALFQGTHNSRNQDVAGVSLTIELDGAYHQALCDYASAAPEGAGLPVEYFRTYWRSFAGNGVVPRTLPAKSSIIDTHASRSLSGADRYVATIIEAAITADDRVGLAAAYRKMRDDFAANPRVQVLNEHLKASPSAISEKSLTVGIDTASRSGWESVLSPYLDQIPFAQASLGEQSAAKMRLALQAQSTSQVVLIEEPENHLSFANMARLIENIAKEAVDRQVVITTHSSFVLNKLGLDKLTMLGANGKHMRLDNLPPDTLNYFLKLPGHDTLRLLLARRAILVEGPSDELIVQRAYIDRHGRASLASGVDVISVKSLAFKRFLDIAILLSLDVIALTDNDGHPEQLKERYAGYLDYIDYDDDPAAPSLEQQILKVNELSVINTILGKTFVDKTAALAFMKAHKTETSLAIFASTQAMVYPGYIARAVQK